MSSCLAGWLVTVGGVRWLLVVCCRSVRLWLVACGVWCSVVVAVVGRSGRSAGQLLRWVVVVAWLVAAAARLLVVVLVVVVVVVGCL